MTKVAKDEGRSEGIDATLDTPAREGARRMIAAALEAEVASYLERYRAERGEDGRAAVWFATVVVGHVRSRLARAR